MVGLGRRAHGGNPVVGSLIHLRDARCWIGLDWSEQTCDCEGDGWEGREDGRRRLRSAGTGSVRRWEVCEGAESPRYGHRSAACRRMLRLTNMPTAVGPAVHLEWAKMLPKVQLSHHRAESVGTERAESRR
jgi:hypothetical protein